MHVSLDSALGRQRRLNSVGESVLQIAPNAAAAYSLRSLTGGDPKVVRVRRASDNHEQDFTASGVSSGALTSFVNAQVTPPLDIRALSATGRDGDFLIAKAAYSLRSLGTRQATLAATGDTVARANGKYVAQVRRSSDDALKSFTADEVTDGTLLAFVNEIQTIGTAVNGTGSFDNYTVSNLSNTGFSADNSAGGTGSAGFPYVFKDEDVLVVKYTVTNFSSTASLSPQIRGVSATNSVTGKTNSGTAFTANGTYTDTLTATANGTHLMFADSNTGSYTISDFEIVSHSSNGFVKTWYDQSVTNQAGDTATGNHAVQATAGNQPLIVSAGALVSDNGIDFDGTTSSRSLVAPSVSGLTGSLSIFSTSVRGATGNTVSLSNSTDNAKYFSIKENASTSVANPRNSTNVSVSDSVSGSDRLTFGVTTGETSFGVGALGGTLVTSTSDYGSDFGSGNLDQIAIGLLRTVSPTGYFNGRIREILVYTSDQTDNRGAIEANIGEAYSITGIPAYDNTVDGFVETWYDQSGNSKDAIQTTANLQPVIVAAGVFQSGLKFDTDGSSSGPDFRTPIDTTDLGTEFALIWVGNVNASQHSDGANHTVLGNLRNVQGFSTGSIGLSVIPATGTSSIKNQQTSTGQESLEDTNAITPGEFGVIFGNYDDGSVLLSVDGSTQTATFSSPVLDSTNNMGIMTAINGNNTVRYANSADGICKEVIIYASTQADNRVALETNINSQYSLF